MAKKVKTTKKESRPKATKKSEKKAAPKAKSKLESKSKPKSQPKPKSKPTVEDEKTRKERLRKLLIQKREDIVKEAKSEIKKFKSGERKQLVETVMDDGDRSVVDLAEDISLKQLSNHRETLIKIDAALMKLQEGTYGTCEECADEISEARLMVMPFAIYCRDCQERKESIAKIEAAEG